MEEYKIVKNDHLQKQVIDACKANSFPLLDVVVEEVVDYLPFSEPLLTRINNSLKSMNLPAVEIYYQSDKPWFYKKYVNEEVGSGLFTCVDVKQGMKINYIPNIANTLSGTTGLVSTPAIDYIAGLSVKKYIEYVMPLPANSPDCCFKSKFGFKTSKYAGPIKASHKGTYVRSAEVVSNALKASWQKFMLNYSIPTFPTIGKEEQYDINYEAVLKQFQLSYCPLTVDDGKVELLNHAGLYVNDPYNQKDGRDIAKENMQMQILTLQL